MLAVRSRLARHGLRHWPSCQLPRGRASHPEHGCVLDAGRRGKANSAFDAVANWWILSGQTAQQGGCKVIVLHAG